MDWTNIIWAGAAATAAMTVLIYMGPLMGMPKMDIAQMQGSMVLEQGNTAFMMGMVMHFIVGIAIAIVYALIWEATAIPVIWWSGLIFGLVHGLIALMVMPMMMKMHKEVQAGRFPNLLKAGGMMGIAGFIVGHLVYGVILGLLYTPA
jgi:uncharacterized membrane protein YagU involved in acid resistance